MAIKGELNLGSLKGKLLDVAMKSVENATLKVFSDVKLYSPIRSGTYFRGHRYKGVIREGNRIIGTVENVGEYPERVEKGFRKTAVNWNLVNLGQIYYSRGASVYEKALAKNKEYFLKMKARG